MNRFIEWEDSGSLSRTHVRIKDVAAHAGVSVGTVSNVLNGLGTVAPELVERVIRSSNALGFVPNEGARSLKSGGSKTVALLVLSTFNPFFNTLADFSEEEADEHGFSVILASSAQRTERESKYLGVFERQRVHGVLLAPISGATEEVRVMHQRGTPFVLLGDSDRDFCSVSVAADVGGFLAVSHLIHQGRRRIAIVGGPYEQVRGRVDGARRAIATERGARQIYIETSDLTTNEGRFVGREIAAMAPEERPDAIFAANDLLAIGIIDSLLRSAHLSIPRDIAVVGHDDIDFAQFTAVPLSSVRQPVEQIARAAVRLLIAEADEGVDHAHVTRVLEPQLVIRESSA